MTSNVSDHQPLTPCSPTDTNVFLDEADALAKRSGQRLTPIRRKVLELLVTESGPAKAYDLMRRLDGQGAAKPPTVYRALDFLQELGLVHKIESLNAYVACGHLRHSHSAVFLICDECGSAEELHAERTSEALKSDTSSVAFRLSQTVIEAHGVCRNCAS